MPIDLNDTPSRPESTTARGPWWRLWRPRPPSVTAEPTLADLRPGQRARIAGVDTRSIIGQRIVQLGMLAGTEVEVVRRAPTGDPIELRVAGYHLSLRNAEARLVSVTVLS